MPLTLPQTERPSIMDDPPYEWRRFSIEEYHRMAEVGIIDRDENLELLRGLVVEKHTPGYLRLFSVDEYEAMIDAGILYSGEPVELLQGEIIKMAAVGNRHAACVDRINSLLSRKVGENAIVRVQSPIRLPDGTEPEPDVALLKSRDDYYESGHPEPEDVLLIVEVADSSIAPDRDRKIPDYAARAIPEVWLVDLPDDNVAVYREPAPAGGGYDTMRRLRRGDGVQSERVPAVRIDDVADVLGSPPSA
jgi:Uma2 family endonuclease